MNYTGYVRQIDPVGRIVLPMDLRIKMVLQNNSHVEFFMDGDSVILRKYQSACIFCDGSKDLIQHNGKQVCSDCMQGLVASHKVIEE